VGARIWLPSELVFLCFFLTAVLFSDAAFAGAITGSAADVIANMASVKSRMTDLFMRFSRWRTDLSRLDSVTPRGGEHSRAFTPT